MATHEVLNQPPPRVDVDEAAENQPLLEAVERHAAGSALDDLHEVGRLVGGASFQRDAAAAHRHPPVLHTHDRWGRRVDEVEYHPAYHRILQAAIAHGAHTSGWAAPRPGAAVARAATFLLFAQVEPGHACPVSMTHAAVPSLQLAPDLARTWMPRVLSRSYDGRLGAGKASAILGMAMTEKQGGSDVRANSTRAERDLDGYRLTGHKWFCSAPMSDGFLTLAQAEGGLTCFLVPRWLPDGTRNPFNILRLKDKLGNRANASAEVEYAGTYAHRLGEEGRGVATIIEMVHHTRLDTALAPAGLMRAALVEALHWAGGRTVFQKRLIDQPLMRAVLADLALEAEASLSLGMEVARAFDDAERRPYARLTVALAKFLSNKRAPGMIYECMEVLGGMGYVEETPLPMLYREAPLNSIWEGSGNVICLDILRTLAREAAAGEQLNARLDAARGQDGDFDTALSAHRDRWPGLPPEAEARWFAESLAQLLAATVMMERSPVAGAYLASHLGGPRGQIAGALAGIDAQAVLERAQPD